MKLNIINEDKFNYKITKFLGKYKKNINELFIF